MRWRRWRERWRGREGEPRVGERPRARARRFEVAVRWSIGPGTWLEKQLECGELTAVGREEAFADLRPD